MKQRWCVIVRQDHTGYCFMIGPFDSNQEACEFSFEADLGNPFYLWEHASEFDFSVSQIPRMQYWKQFIPAIREEAERRLSDAK